ncbi:MAG: hypothetical protein ABUL60_14845 [Myxococcales bacterium]
MAPRQNIIHGVLTTQIVTLSARPAPLSRTASAIVATRLPKDAAHRFIQLARSNGTTAGELLRTLVLASAAPASADTIAAIAKLVGLPLDALPSEVVQAVQDLAAEIPMADPASADPLSGGDAAPAPAKLSKAELAACKRHGQPATPAGYRAVLSRMTKRVGPGAPPAAPVALSAPAVTCPAPFTQAELAYAERERIPREQLRAHLADRRARAVKHAK